MKHKHRFQFVEEIGTHPIFKIIDVKDVWNMERKCIGWVKARFRFVCECGKSKYVEEK